MEARLSPNDTLDNRYLVSWRAGQGKAGGAVYAAKDIRSSDGARVALKFPVKPIELEVLKDLQRKCDEACEECFWMPRVLSWGQFRGFPYAVTEMLSRPLPAVFERLKGVSLGTRWRALRAVGRQLVRRLEAIHRHGFVHCDIQPNNILMHSRSADGGIGDERPYLVDFGTAAPYPGGEPQRPDRGSVDFNSINTASGGVRGPCDDLEAVGWVLSFGLFGELPWFEVTRTARWSQGRLSEEDCPIVCGEVRDAKASLMSFGSGSFGSKWDHLEDLPLELAKFLRMSREGCRAAGANAKVGRLPDYEDFTCALGGRRGMRPEDAEYEDLGEYRAALAAATSAAEGGEAGAGLPEAAEIRTLRNPGAEEVPPHMVDVEVRHALFEQESITVQVLNTGSVRDVRMAVLSKLGSSKLSDVKLVQRIGKGDTPTFATMDDAQPIEDRRRFTSMGRSLATKGTSQQQKAVFTLERALAMQAELRRGFEEPGFQSQLQALRKAHNFQGTPQYRQAHAELCLTVQREVLPSYGFTPDTQGISTMIRATRSFGADEDIRRNHELINKAIGAFDSQH